jgi:hypothetical protein
MAAGSNPPRVSFRTTLLQAGKTATGIEVPPELVAELGSGQRPPVQVSINGRHTYPSTVAVMAGAFMVPVSAAHRTAAGIEGGQEIDVVLTLDLAPRETEVPADLAAALAGQPQARERFDALAPSRRKAHVVAVEGAKTAETRQRRIEAVLNQLRPE